MNFSTLMSKTKSGVSLAACTLDDSYRTAVIDAASQIEDDWTTDAKSRFFRTIIAERHPDLSWGILVNESGKTGSFSYLPKNTKFAKVVMG